MDFIIKEKGFEPDEIYYTQLGMIDSGGSFVKALGEALVRADLNNARRIRTAFPEYWDKYQTWGKKIFKEGKR